MSSFSGTHNDPMIFMKDKILRDNDKINENPMSLIISALCRPSDVCGKSKFI